MDKNRITKYSTATITAAGGLMAIPEAVPATIAAGIAVVFILIGWKVDER